MFCDWNGSRLVPAAAVVLSPTVYIYIYIFKLLRLQYRERCISASSTGCKAVNKKDVYIFFFGERIQKISFRNTYIRFLPLLQFLSSILAVCIYSVYSISQSVTIYVYIIIYTL